MIMVIITSTDPVFFGYLMDNVYSFAFLAKGAFILTIAVIAFIVRILKVKS